LGIAPLTHFIKSYPGIKALDDNISHTQVLRL